MKKPINLNFFRVAEEAAESKYKNKITYVGEFRFHSAKEANRFCELQLLIRGGLIKDLKRQVSFELIPKNGKERAINYVCDFQYYDIEKGRIVVEDVKGYITEVYKIKKRMMKTVHGIDILEV